LYDFYENPREKVEILIAYQLPDLQRLKQQEQERQVVDFQSLRMK
jgi:hypothetical protein